MYRAAVILIYFSAAALAAPPPAVIPMNQEEMAENVKKFSEGFCS